MTTKRENTENNCSAESELPTKQELRNLNASGQRIGSRLAVSDGEPEDLELLARKAEHLREFVLPERYESLSRRLDFRTRYMIMCLEDIYYPHNASAVIRSSEAFGLQEMHAVENTVRFSPSKHVVRGTDQWMDIHRWGDTLSLVEHLRGRGYRIVVTAPPRINEPSIKGVNCTPSDFNIEAGPFALFMGTEKSGASEWLMDQADATVSIPMVGFAESLNISVSAAIVAQRLTERLRGFGEQDNEEPIAWQLDTEDRTKLLYRWLCNSVRDDQNILKRGGY